MISVAMNQDVIAACRSAAWRLFARLVPPAPRWLLPAGGVPVVADARHGVVARLLGAGARSRGPPRIRVRVLRAQRAAVSRRGGVGDGSAVRQGGRRVGAGRRRLRVRRRRRVGARQWPRRQEDGATHGRQGTNAYTGVRRRTRAYAGVRGRTRAYAGVRGRTRAYAGVRGRTRAYAGVRGRTRSYASVYGRTLAGQHTAPQAMYYIIRTVRELSKGEHYILVG